MYSIPPKVRQSHSALHIWLMPGTSSYSDLDRHPENQALPGVIAFRPEASLS
jgi:hypothetical protein